VQIPQAVVIENPDDEQNGIGAMNEARGEKTVRSIPRSSQTAVTVTPRYVSSCTAADPMAPVAPAR
jgi:hypothetical protein